MKGTNFYLRCIRALEARIAVLEADRFLFENKPMFHRKDLMQKFAVSISTIDRAKADGRLPKPIYFCGPLWTPAQLRDVILRD
jgi:hypothetical protein